MVTAVRNVTIVIQVTNVAAVNMLNFGTDVTMVAALTMVTVV